MTTPTTGIAATTPDLQAADRVDAASRHNLGTPTRLSTQVEDN
jgi:hypothetical protein